MVTTIVEHRNIISGSVFLSGAWNTTNEIINPTYPGAIGKGAVRGIRIRNLEPSGWYVSGFQQLRLGIDGRWVASGTFHVNYNTSRGAYVNLGMFTLGSDYHESPWIIASGVPATNCACEFLVNEQRIPFHREFRLQGRWIWRSGWHNGFTVDAWYELKE